MPGGDEALVAADYDAVIASGENGLDEAEGTQALGERRELRGRRQVVTDPAIRSAVRSALVRQLGLDLSAAVDGAA